MLILLCPFAIFECDILHLVGQKYTCTFLNSALPTIWWTVSWEMFAGVMFWPLLTVPLFMNCGDCLGWVGSLSSLLLSLLSLQYTMRQNYYVTFVQ